ncbi:MAG: DUF5654 family protein [Patescibacteria group bacterium]
MDFTDPKFRKTLAEFARLALGVLVALAWKEPINYFAQEFLPPGAAFFTLFLFALGVTLFAVFAMIFLSKFLAVDDSKDDIQTPDVDSRTVVTKTNSVATSSATDAATNTMQVNDPTTTNQL